MQFSPEIQGIRAISILAVVAFHFGIGGRGGYLGVDIFFVISGYLITGLIQESISRNNFSLIQFYKNRAVRLFPNLMLMILTSIVVSYLLLKPYDLFQYAKSLQFSSVYVTNIVFSKQQSYFDISREVKPLLHTWSLSIEEQFYLFFPIILISLRNQSNTRKLFYISFLVILSFFYKTWLITHLPEKSFFSFLGRAWELGLGSIFALLPSHQQRKIAGNKFYSQISLATIVLYLLFLNENMTYAGIISAGCCIATGVLILSGPNTLVGNFLKSKPMLYLGGISYALYLWHWLVLITFRNLAFRINDLLELFLMVVLSLTMAHVTWRYVENPLRKNKNNFSVKHVYFSVILFTLVTASLGSYIYAKEGFPNRFPQYAEVSKNMASFDWAKNTGTPLTSMPECEMKSDKTKILSECVFGDSDGKSTVLVIGDSHVNAIRPAFDTAAKKANIKGVVTYGRGCPPILGIQSYDGSVDICKPLNIDRNLKKIAASQKFSKVYLVSFWGLYANGSYAKERLQRPSHFISDHLLSSNSAKQSQIVMERGLENTINYFNGLGSEVVIVEDVPTLPEAIQELPKGFTQPIEVVESEQFFMKNFLKKHTKKNKLSSINLLEAFCTASTCSTYSNGYYLYLDNNHITAAGASHTISLIQKSMEN